MAGHCRHPLPSNRCLFVATIDDTRPTVSLVGKTIASADQRFRDLDDTLSSSFTLRKMFDSIIILLLSVAEHPFLNIKSPRRDKKNMCKSKQFQRRKYGELLTL